MDRKLQSILSTDPVVEGKPEKPGEQTTQVNQKRLELPKETRFPILPNKSRCSAEGVEGGGGSKPW